MYECFVCVDALHPSIQFFSHVGMSFPVFLGKTSNKQRMKCLAQGDNKVPLVSLQLATPRSQVGSTLSLSSSCVKVQGSYRQV